MKIDSSLLLVLPTGCRVPIVGDAGHDGEEEILGIEMLTNLLPRIPEHATMEERVTLQERITLIHRDVGAYKRIVAEINERDIG